MRRENCLVNCEIIFHISPFKPANSTKSLYCVCQKKNPGAGIVLLGAANGCYLWKKNAFLLMEDNGFLYLALICTSVVLEPCWFFWGLDTHRVALCHLGATLWGEMLVPEEGIVALGWWMVTLCSCPSAREWLGHRELLSEGVCWSDCSSAFFPFF